MHATVDLKNQVRTLVDLLRFRAGFQPDDIIYSFLSDEHDDIQHITYGELDRKAQAVAARLAEIKGYGERALMLYPSGLDFIVAFFGCMYAGVIGVPAYPPRKNHNLNRLKAIIDDCDTKFVLTTSKVLRVAEPLFSEVRELDKLNWVVTDNISEEAAADWKEVTVHEDNLAFLQYTSGSTGTPKGVMVSHKNLIFNEAMMDQCFKLTPEDRFASWLPLFHDMGLIGAALHPLYIGSMSILMTPASFLQKPIRWLKAASDHRCAVLVAPNFAYELCARQITEEQKASLDLSCVKRAFSGAETVRASTVRHFSEAFRESGFNPDSHSPVYGLAESTLFISGRDMKSPLTTKNVSGPELRENRFVESETDDPTNLEIVSIGVTDWGGQKVKIVDPEKLVPVDDGCIGEIWSKGDHIAQGYWQRKEATKETFQAYVKGTNDGPYLRTGDLGCIVDGELFFTGRAKELLVIRGRNHYPQDIEKTVEKAHPALRTDNGAAFTVEVEGEERLVIVQEVERQYRRNLDVEAVSKAIRKEVAEKHELQVYSIVFVKPGRVLKTSSGKIQRRGCKQAYLDNQLDIIAEAKLATEKWSATVDTDIELSRQVLIALDQTDRLPLMLNYLKQELANRVGVDSSDIEEEEALLQLGMDSLMVTQFAAQLREALEIEITQQELLAVDNLKELALSVVDLCERAPISVERIVRSEGLGHWPLSFSQQRLWFLEELEQGATAYNLSSALKLKGPIDSDALKKAIDGIVKRHESLRTTFVEENGVVGQKIQSPFSLDLPVEDLQDLTGTAKVAAIQGLATTDAARAIDLKKGPLLRTRLLLLGNNSKGEPESILLLTVHHIAADGWSTGIFVEELNHFYQYYALGKKLELEPLSIQYKDYALWQRNTFTDEYLDNQLEYWKKQLKDAPVLELPTVKRRPAVRSGQGADYRFTISEKTTNGLKAFSQRQSVTLYMTLMTAFKTLLHRYSGSGDICVGTPIAGRNREELDPLIGFLVNTVVLRTQFDEDPNFIHLLQQVRKTTLESFANQDVPFERIVDELGVKRDISYTPLFQVMFAFQNTPHSIDGHNPLGIETLDLDVHGSKFDLSLNVEERTGQLHCQLEYSTDLFDEEYIENFSLHLTRLLESILRNSDQPISQFAILSESEKHHLLVELNATRMDFPWHRCIHQMVEEQVLKSPNAIAVVDGNFDISYGVLNKRANQLARYLQQQGVGRESLVCISADRNVDMLVAMLAVLKAGGAYVPLDPNYPADRVAYMLADAQAPILLTHSHIKESLPRNDHTKIVCLDSDSHLWKSLSEENLNNDISPQQLAYVIYTSGSTGLPKGVAIEHRNAAAMVQWSHSVFTADDLKGVLFATSICFDLSVWECFVTLSFGGSIIIAENALALAQLPGKDRVTLINTVPSAIAALYRQGQIPKSVRTINLAGEALAQSLVDQLYGLGHIEQVFDLYGPSEDTTYSTFTLREQGGFANIGRPIANTQAYVLDANGAILPKGIPGELYLSGWGLARGYLHREELTAEKFVSNPFKDHEERMYRTGDLVRYLEDGRLEYLGRIDHQVKIRGFRIELGEVEACLAGHDAVRQGLVMTQEDESGDKWMVAYLLVKPGRKDHPPSIKDIRAYLKTQLPEYMVPSAFVLMDSFPLTPNGKVDRKALPKAEITDQLSSEYVAPSSNVERELVVVWEAVLNRSPIGVQDDFFLMGGHSLLATQIIARVREIFGVELLVKDLFRAPTIAEQAELIAELSASEPEIRDKIEVVDRSKPLALSSAQQRLWFLDQMESRDVGHKTSSSYNMSGAVRFKGTLNVEALKWAFQQVMDRHETLRTNIKFDNGHPVQVINDSVPVFLDVRDLTDLHGEHLRYKVKALALDEATRSFDIELTESARRTRLLRTRLLKLNDQEYVLLVTMHHIISDGWSLGVLMKEVGFYYASYLQGGDDRLEPLRIQYADYAAWQNEQLANGELDNQLAYWRDQLADAAALDLPTDYPRPPVQTFHGSRVDFAIGEQQLEQLGQFAQKNNLTLYMVLVAALNIVLHRYSRQEDICIGTPIANRRYQELEALIGCFVNTLVLRSQLSKELSVKELLEQVKTNTLGAYAHQDMPFEILVDELGVARDSSRSPLFQVMFSLQNTPRDQGAEFAAIDMEVLPNQAQTAKFDLTIILTERNGVLVGEWEYNTDLFARETIEGYVRHFKNVLTRLPNNLNSPVSTIELLDQEEFRVLTQSVTDHSQVNRFQSESCLHQIFEGQVERYGSKVAITLGEDSISYRDLNGRANQLAHYLIEKGVCADQLVGICMDRSINMVVSLLGILKAGGGYLPLDPSNPKERIDFVLQDALGNQDVKLVITEGEAKSLLPLDGYEQVDLDDENVLVGYIDENPNLKVSADSRAYIIYTSGTTGQPKGVLIPHRNVTRLFKATDSNYGFNDQDVWTLFHSFAFDFSVWEIWGALLFGGRLVIVPQMVAKSPEDFYQLVLDQKVTVLNQTPSAFTQFIKIDLKQGEACSAQLALRYVIFGGEALDFAALLEWRERHPLDQIKLINMYGITETTVHVTHHQVTNDDLLSRASLIGQPIADLQAVVLDDVGHPAPAGVPGELYIGGAGLAIGYLNRPDLTAERFIDNPFDPDTKLYRTGDLVRILANGTLEYMGRIDDQVKIRGFRIELGEVVSVIQAQDPIRDCVAIVREDNPGDKRIVAYLVGDDVDVVDVRSECRKRLPEYMIPSAFVVLDTLPLTSNGKVDKKSLPKPEGDLNSSVEYVAPRNDTETDIAAIWSDVLELEKVGVHDVFFDIGGNSLLATQVISRLRKQFDLDVPLATLFEMPTVEGLALYVLESAAEDLDDAQMADLLSEIEGLNLDDLD